MNISENIKIKTGNNLLKKCLEKEHSFKTILLLTFFILLPFSNFSIAGDLESLLKCRLIELNQNIINVPTSVNIEINISSGPWCENSVISLRSPTILFIISPDSFSSK